MEREIDIDKAYLTSIQVLVFVKGGDCEYILIPKDFFVPIAIGLRDKGEEVLQFAGGNEMIITAIMATGAEFHNEPRVFVIKGDTEH